MRRAVDVPLLQTASAGRDPGGDLLDEIRIDGTLQLRRVAREPGRSFLGAQNVSQPFRRRAGERPADELSDPRDVLRLDLDVP
jgi:hypothetical protein